tara:strand:+ start:4130 stop:5113 length:984 start_codon:yes stop_codon:yes gene_type:complete
MKRLLIDATVVDHYSGALNKFDFRAIKMNIKNKLKVVAGGFLALTIQVACYADEHHASTKSYKVTDISPSIKLLQGKGGNIGALVGKQGILLVDDDYGEMSDALVEAIQPLGGQDKLAYIINTHWHGDHTQGNKVLGHHAPIVAHDNVRQRLLTQQEIALFGMTTEPYPEVALPSVTYHHKMNLYINDEQVQLIHLPGGHTDGDSIVHFKNSNVIHLGDHFFNGFFPFVDVQNGGNVVQMAKNLRGILDLIDEKTVIIPGHGPLADKADLVAFIEMLEGTSAEVKALKDKGLSLEKIQAKGLSSQWDSWTDGFLNTPMWIGIVYSSL